LIVGASFLGASQPFQSRRIYCRGRSITSRSGSARRLPRSLNGLPASALDALKLLPSSPEALIRLLFSARDAGERGAVWSLQNELPFLWLALPLPAWQTTLQSDYAAIAKALEGVFGREKAASEALARLASLRDELIVLEPALEMTFSLVGPPATQATAIPWLRELTSGYIAGQYHRGGEAPNDVAARLASVEAILDT
jgi:hypothetical protein